MRVRLVCEGNLDGRVGRHGQCEGAAKIILRRILSNDDAEHAAGFKFDVRKLASFTKGGGFRRKIVEAISDAAEVGGIDALVVLVDRDKAEYDYRLAELLGGISDMEQQDSTRAMAARTVAGMAIEELEAWLLADANFLTSKLGEPKGIPNPEEVRKPKERFQQLLAKQGMDRAYGYDFTASHINLVLVEKKWKAFKRFVADVRTKLA